jgi:hypothetical protein
MPFDHGSRAGVQIKAPAAGRGPARAVVYELVPPLG